MGRNNASIVTREVTQQRNAEEIVQNKLKIAAVGSGTVELFETETPRWSIITKTNIGLINQSRIVKIHRRHYIIMIQDDSNIKEALTGRHLKNAENLDTRDSSYTSNHVFLIKRTNRPKLS